MLVVFAIALTPWNLFHHHQKAPVNHEVNCKHVSHVESRTDDCLICHAGFEKDYVKTHTLYRIFLSVKIFGRIEPVMPCAYVQLKHTSLRGPPIA
ncbi:hypothetical protein [Pedobacter sp. MW01-1-1]|uniref:hypothetical protein n=1 Tax=Pedobacter sp. MW01-1-1 TaxID=3383027 RepID=UPI003FEDF7A5